MAERDSFGAIWRDAVAKVKPHATIENAVKIIGAVNGVLDAAIKVRQIKPPPVYKPQKGK